MTETPPPAPTHTPGPWRVVRMYKSSAVMSGAARICRLYRSAVNPRHEHDAHIVAAAPDMLAALKECHAAMLRDYPVSSRAAGNWPTTGGWFARVEAAILKAEGPRPDPKDDQ